MRFGDVRVADRLIHQREMLSTARWNVIARRDDGKLGGSHDLWDAYPLDEKLAQAVEEFRKRKIDEIDTKLRELNVDIDAEGA